MRSKLEQKVIEAFAENFDLDESTMDGDWTFEQLIGESYSHEDILSVIVELTRVEIEQEAA